MRIVKRLAHVLVIVLTLRRRRDGGRDHRVADRVVQELAARLHRARGEPVSERHAVDRAARRQSVLRRRDGEHRRVDGRQPGRRGQGSRPRLQRVPADHEGAVGRQHPPGQAGDLSAARRRHLVAQPAGQEAGDRKPIAAGPPSPIAIDAIGITDGSVVVDVAGRHVRRRGAEALRSPRREAVVQVRAGALLDRDHPRVVPRFRSGARRSTRCRAASRSRTTRVFVDKLALRTAETSLSIDGAVQHYLTTPIFNLQISSDKLSLPEIARLVPALAGIRLQPAFDVKAERAARSPRRRDERAVVGRAAGSGNARRRRYRRRASRSPGDLSVKHLDLAPLLNDPTQKSDITATRASICTARRLSNSTRCTARSSIDSPRIVAAGYVAERVHAKARIDGRRVGLDGERGGYGAAATVAGNVTLPDRRRSAPSRSIFTARRGTSICASCRASEGPAGGDRRQRRLSRRRIAGPAAGPRAGRRRPSLRAVDGRRRAIAAGSTAGVTIERRGRSATGPTRRSRTSICSASARRSTSRRWRPSATRARSTGTSSREAAARRRRRWT